LECPHPYILKADTTDKECIEPTDADLAIWVRILTQIGDATPDSADLVL